MLERQCDLGTKENMMIRDCLVLGVRDDKLRERLLQQQDLTLTNASEMARASEAKTKTKVETIAACRQCMRDTKGWKSRKESLAERETSPKATDRGLQLLAAGGMPQRKSLVVPRRRVQ